MRVPGQTVSYESEAGSITYNLFFACFGPISMKMLFLYKMRAQRVKK